MRKTHQIAFGVILTLALSGVWLLAKKKPWTQPMETWEGKDIVQMLTDSPWAEKYIRTRQITGRGTGQTGEKELYDVFTVRFFSALPVRKSYFRMLQLHNEYDKLDEPTQEAFNQKFSAVLRMDVSNRIIVAVDFESNDRQLDLQIQRNFKNTTTEHLRQSAFLISDRIGRVELAEYFPPAPDGTGAKFIFPRVVEGEPVVAPKDKNVKFELYLNDFGKVLVTKKVKELSYEGKLEI